MTQDSPNIESAPQDPLMEVGTALRQIREQQGISLESLAAQTKIQRRILQAIEAGDWSPLPEPIYIRGFVNRYATALGLDGATLSQKIPIAPIVQATDYTDTRFKPTAQLRPSHLYGIYVVLIAAAVWGLSILLQRTDTQRPPIPVASSPSVSQSPTPSPPSPTLTSTPSGSPSPPSTPTTEASDSSESASPEAPAPEEVSLTVQSWLTVVKFPDTKQFAVNSKAVNVKVQLTSQAWVRIVIDGKVEFEGVLPQGTDRTWAADQTLVVRSGNAGAVLLGFNGEAPKPLGDAGAVREVAFNEQGANS